MSGKESQKPKKQQHQETKLAYEKEKTMDQLLMHYKSRKTVGQTHPSLLVMIVISYFSSNRKEQYFFYNFELSTLAKEREEG